MADRDDLLRTDLAHGLRFLHKMGDETRRAVYETALTVLALVEELRETGRIEDAEHARRVAQAEIAELARVKENSRVRMELRVDKYAITDLPDIPCDELIPLCRGRCCTLHFSLSKQDLNERVVKWNYQFPYVIRQREDGYCVHNDPATRGCTVYEHRPATCRSYECRNDKRIWVDFEKRIPVVDPRLEPRDAPVPFGEAPQ
jgi:Fe-S-cluster containining protein